MSMKRALEWAASGDTGLSSCAILAAALGHPKPRAYPPLDTGELGRCLRLIAAWPAARRGITALAAVDPVWAEIDRDWRRIAAAAREEGVAEARSALGGGHAKTYALLREALRRGAQAQRAAA